MGDIIGKEKVIDKIGVWFPFKCQIVNIKYSGTASILELTIIPDINTNIAVELCFDGVRDVSISKIRSDGINCALFEIIDYKKYQIENINWWVGDFKADTISFFARSITVTSVCEEDNK